ncbi:MAG: zinc-ribbon domain-containing protein [Clostridia bacterium]|nr:zinc-ribbon domain-containing protein [Clostridia bacterium]
MYCIKCGKELPNDSLFCVYCGAATKKPSYARAEETKQDENDYTQELPNEPVDEGVVGEAPILKAAEQPATRKAVSKKKVNKKLLLIGGIALIVVLAAVIIPLSLHGAKQSRYDEGTALFERGEYAEALTVFSELGDFDDSKAMAARAEKEIDYESAKADMQSERFEAAKSAFDALGDFKDAAALSKECQKALDYQSAEALYLAGDFEQAQALFISAGDFEDAEERSEECGSFIDYNTARALMENGDYEAAELLLSPLDAATFPDRDELLSECRNMPIYLEAAAQPENGDRYSAYTLFLQLGDYLNSAELAASCIVSAPATGETYRNYSYQGSDCSLTVKPPTDDGSKTYIKVYTSEGTLVCCVYIAAGDSATIDLPAGDYRLKVAYGYGDWFGAKDMFGDEGTYQVLKVNSWEEIFSFERNYVYTLTLRTSGAGGDDVATENESREDF